MNSSDPRPKTFAEVDRDVPKIILPDGTERIYYGKKQKQFLFDPKQVLKENELYRMHQLHKYPKDQLGAMFLRYGVKPTDKFRKQKVRDLVGGRGSAKTNTGGKLVKQLFLNLPRTTFGLGCLTYGQLLNNTLPEIKYALYQEHLVEGKHYVVGKEPPKHWIRPYRKMGDYKYMVSFINGFSMLLMSQDAGDIYRGLSLDGLILDEKAFLKKEWIDNVIMPTVRANRLSAIAKNPLHHLVAGFTSPPHSLEGMWIYDNEEWARKKPHKYFFMEASARDNVDVLGEEYIELQRELLPLLRFEIEIEGKRPTSIADGYYFAFDRDAHVDYKTYGYAQDEKTGLYTKGWTDYSAKAPLMVSFDFNVAFMSCVVAQLKPDSTLRIINEFWVKNKEIEHLVDKVAEHYSDHTGEHKRVLVYGDPNGHHFVDGTTRLDLYKRIKTRFKSKKWQVQVKAPKQSIEHRTRRYIINKVLQEDPANRLRVRFNHHTCSNTIISIEYAPVLDDGTKDKKSEKQDIEQEKATHLSDCFDYLLYMLAAPMYRFGGAVTGGGGEVDL